MVMHIPHSQVFHAPPEAKAVPRLKADIAQMRAPVPVKAGDGVDKEERRMLTLAEAGFGLTVIKKSASESRPGKGSRSTGARPVNSAMAGGGSWINLRRSEYRDECTIISSLKALTVCDCSSHSLNSCEFATAAERAMMGQGARRRSCSQMTPSSDYPMQ
jgi:hypothetical protein